jgi:hypothetical protein
MSFASYPAWRLCLIAALGAPTLVAQEKVNDEQATFKLASVIDRHESAIGLIHSADVTVSVKCTERGGVKQDPAVAMWKLRWSKSGTMSRIRCENLHSSIVDARGDSVDRFVDVLEDGETMSILLNWDPIKRPRLEARDQRTVQAYTYPQSPQLPGLIPSVLTQHALFEIAANAFDSRRTVRQLFAQSPGVSDASLVEFDGEQLVVVKAVHPDTRFGKTYKNTKFEIYFDPTLNYLVRRVRVLTPPDSSKGLESGLIEDRVAGRFEKFENGVWFPMLVEVDIKSAGRSYSNSKYLLEVTDITINDELPQDAMDFQFPENCVVVHNPPVDGRRKGTLYGKDNKPIKDVASINELPELPDQIGESWFNRNSLYWLGVFALFALLVVAIVVRIRGN